MPHFPHIAEIETNHDGAGLRIGVVVCRFNTNICEGLLLSCKDALTHLGVADQDVLICNVPGALEAPLVLQTLANSGQFDALIALGAVIRGETYHFELVANESGAGITQVGLATGVPIANAILTTEDDDQALVRMHEKGADAARVAVEMARLQANLRQRFAV